MPAKLIVPGLNGSGEGHWQHYWLKDDPDAVLVAQKDWSNPDLADWVERLEAAVLRHPGCIIVAHSLGAVVTSLLATRPSRHLVKGALLVAPCSLARVNSLHPDVVRETARPVAARLPFRSTVVASSNDHYMPFEQARHFAKDLGSEFVDLGHAGHINIDSGYGRWRKGYRLAARLDIATQQCVEHRVPEFMEGIVGVEN